MTNRNIIKTVTGIRTQDGAGVNLVRVITGRNTEDFDPFLMMHSILPTLQIMSKVFRGTLTAE